LYPFIIVYNHTYRIKARIDYCRYEKEHGNGALE